MSCCSTCTCPGWTASAPAAACVRFALRVPGVRSVALNTADPRRVPANAALGAVELPGQLWRDLAEAGLIDRRFA